MLSLDSLLGLFNTFSQTNHHNFALAVALTILVFHSRLLRAFSQSYAGLVAAGRFAISMVRRLPQRPIALGLLAILSILIVVAPASVQTLKGGWAPVSLSAHRPANDLVSNLPRTTDETTATRQTETAPVRDGILKKTSAFPLWILIFTYLASTFSFLTARFKRAAVTLRDWFRHLYQLLDLPPPSSIPASV
jgi:hypothetical protein